MKNKMALFAKDEMVDDTCKTISIPDGNFTREIFAVFKEGGYFVYENRCPHTGSPLDWMPDQFLNLDKTLIQCSTHHALFRIEDGYCIAGPCSGQGLSAVSVLEQDGVIWLQIDRDPGPQ